MLKYTFGGIILKNMDEFLKNSELIMNFQSDDIALCQKCQSMTSPYQLC
jgi:hypothetical protein